MHWRIAINRVLVPPSAGKILAALSTMRRRVDVWRGSRSWTGSSATRCRFSKPMDPFVRSFSKPFPLWA